MSGRYSNNNGDKSFVRRTTGDKTPKPGDVLIRDLRSRLRRLKTDAKGNLKKIERSVLRKLKSEKSESYNKLSKPRRASTTKKLLQEQHSEAAAIQGNFAIVLPVLAESAEDEHRSDVSFLTEDIPREGQTTQQQVSDILTDTVPIAATEDSKPEEIRTSLRSIELTAIETEPNMRHQNDDQLPQVIGTKEVNSPSKALRTLVQAGNQTITKVIKKLGGGGPHDMQRLGSVDELPKVHVPTPGELRLEVLEWLYEERNTACHALSLSNFSLFEDLVPVFVNVILHGTSKMIRKRIWAFLLTCAAESTHFAFLIVCHLYSMQGEDQVVADISKVNESREIIESKLVSKTHATTSEQPLSQSKALGGNDGHGALAQSTDVDKLEKVSELLEAIQNDRESETNLNLRNAMQLVRQVHDTQLFNKLHAGPTRSNISMLVEKVRNGVLNRGGQEKLSDLDGKLAFIQSLTNLDEWLMRSCAREERQAAVVRHLAALNESALEFGAYFPTATEKVGSGHKLLKLLVDETIVFNTAQKCPFLLVAEVQCSDDRLHCNPHGLEVSSKTTVTSLGDKHSINGKVSRSVSQQQEHASDDSSDAFNSDLPEPPSVSLHAKQLQNNGDDEKLDQDNNDTVARGRRLSSLDLVLTDHRSDSTSDVVANQTSGEVTKGTSPRTTAGGIKPVVPNGYVDTNSTNHSSTRRATESWEELVLRIQRESQYSSLPGWGVSAMFVKAGDDLRQQQLGLLLVSTFQKIFLEENVGVWLSPYKVIATSASTGLLEPARNADSIARIKERGGYNSLKDYFVDCFGKPNTASFKKAQGNFLESLAGYSIVSYLLKLHDRHNGNILVDTEGHLLHIDFGFMLGHYHKLERSPFKLTKELVQVLGGWRSSTFQRFRRLMEQAYEAASKHEREIVLLVDLMSVGSQSPCFARGRRWVIDELRGRLNPGLSKRRLRIHINDMIDLSIENLSTRCYDKYQRCVNGIW